MSTEVYSVRCLFAYEGGYEERITLWRADSFAAAIALAEQEAEEFAERVEMPYVGLAQCYHLFEDPAAQGAEVYSLMRNSDLAPDDYIDAFFDTGTERQRNFE